MEKDTFQGRGMTTLNVLKDELHSLNRRMLLAMQTRDEAEQARITEEIAAVQEKTAISVSVIYPPDKRNWSAYPKPRRKTATMSKYPD